MAEKYGLRKKRMKEYLEARDIKKVDNINDDKIGLLKQQIKLCEWDLENRFPGNSLIEGKIKNMKEQIVNLEQEK